MVKLPGVQAHQGHEMLQFRMFRTGYERLMTAKLGLEKPSGLHVSENHLAESVIHGQRDALQVGFGSLGSGPALVTVHLPTTYGFGMQPVHDSFVSGKDGGKIGSWAVCQNPLPACQIAS
jgi:hypothetical protein